MILGNMQDEKFNLINIIKDAARWHGHVEVVTNTVEGGIHRINYAQIYERTKQLANALTKLGIKSGDRKNRFICVDISFLPVITNVLDRLPILEGLIVLTDRAHMPDTSDIKLPVYCYEDLIAGEATDYN